MAPVAAKYPGVPVGAEASMEVAEITGAGLGLRATRAIDTGEVLLSVKLAECWPAADDARERLSITEDGLSEEAFVALWLCEELQRGAASPFAEQLATLPSELDGILHWSDEEVAELQGTCFQPFALELREETETEWELVSQLVNRPGLDRARFRWAKAVVLSRQLELDGAKVVVPGFDLLNHSDDPNCVLEADTSSVTVCSARAVAPGEELRISYGPLPNASLLISHGFVMDHNARDCVELLLSFALPPPRRPLLRALEAPEAFELVVDGGDDAAPAFEFASRHNLTLEVPLPPTLLASVRLQMLPQAELDSLLSTCGLCAPAGSLAAAGEAAAVERVRGILKGLLAGHGSAAAEDAELLKSDLPRRKRMAVMVRLAEKEILAAALRSLPAE